RNLQIQPGGRWIQFAAAYGNGIRTGNVQDRIQQRSAEYGRGGRCDLHLQYRTPEPDGRRTTLRAPRGRAPRLERGVQAKLQAGYLCKYCTECDFKYYG